MLDLGWLYANNTVFLDFVKVLNKASDNKELFDSVFVKTLLNVYWAQQANLILWKIFIPYVVYHFLTLTFMVHAEQREISAENEVD